MKTLFGASAILTSALGALWLCFPRAMFNALDIPAPEPIAVYMARRYGALFFGYAAIMWLVRVYPDAPARVVILAGGVVLAVVIGVVSVMGVLSGVVGPAMWGAALIELAVAVAFAIALKSIRS